MKRKEFKTIKVYLYLCYVIIAMAHVFLKKSHIDMKDLII